jgi:hypothetical protein
MKIINYLIISFLALLAGAIMVALHYDWLIVQLPTQKRMAKSPQATSAVQRKKVALSFWKNNKWKVENSDILVSEDLATTLEHLLNAWLAILEEEQILDKKVTLQAVLITPADQAYISLDCSPFAREASTWTKLMWMEGLLKTIRENGAKIRQVQLLVHHKPLQDYHLDFSNPWPIQGFLAH